MRDREECKKIFVNVAMTIIYLLLMTLSITGVLVHEILGVAILVLVMIHIIYHKQWLKVVGQGIFNNRIKVRAKVMWIVDIVMIISMLIIIVTGIGISKYIFSFLNIGNSNIMKSLHVSASYIFLISISIHIGFHFNWVLNMFRRIWGIKEDFKTRKIILRVLAIILVLNGIRVSFQEDIASKIVSPITGSSNEEKFIQYPEENSNGVPNNNNENSDDNTDSETEDDNEIINNEQYSISNLSNNSSYGDYSSDKSMERGRPSQGNNNFGSGNDEYGYEQQPYSGGQDYGSQYGGSDNGSQNTPGNGEFNGNTEGGMPGYSNGAMRIKESSSGGNLDSIFNTVSIMSIYVAGTYYTVKLLDKKKERNVN
ncbi:putative membrane protein [Clostridium bornimense]|uniref:Putative membrane protein n=1 Tax=Clostridium bornimense TaxID=1216932 RepID=W6RUQ3_9CLOT|nr:DUF4405 domain-containing protein [Clostridium bornimense]CDM68043.1 putative membrane protein [Clostridium bornimense]